MAQRPPRANHSFSRHRRPSLPGQPSQRMRAKWGNLPSVSPFQMSGDSNTLHASSPFERSFLTIPALKIAGEFLSVEIFRCCKSTQIVGANGYLVRAPSQFHNRQTATTPAAWKSGRIKTPDQDGEAQSRRSQSQLFASASRRASASTRVRSSATPGRNQYAAVCRRRTFLTQTRRTRRQRSQAQLAPSTRARLMIFCARHSRTGPARGSLSVVASTMPPSIRGPRGWETEMMKIGATLLSMR